MYHSEKSLKKNSAVNLIKTVLGLVFPLITFPYASRILGVENIGRVNFANSIMNYFVLLAGLGISNYAIREGAKIRDNQEATNTFCTEILIINICSTLFSYLGVFILLQIPTFYPYKSLLLLFSTTILFNVIGINWLFNIYEEFVYITIRTILFQIVSLFFLLTLVKKQSDFMVYAGILVLSSVGANVFNIFYSRKFVRFFPGEPYAIKKHLKPILVIFGMSIASTIYLNLDMTMLGLQAGDYQTGLYTAASKLNKVVCNVIASVCAVFLPRLAYYLQMNRKEDFQTLVDKAFYYILGLTIPATIGMLVLSKEIVLVFSGTAFLDAVPAAMIKAPNIILSVINGFIAIQLFMPLNKEKESLYATIAGAVMNCILNYLMIPKWGAAGAAFATICAEGAVFLICLICLKGIYPLRNLAQETWKYLIGGTGILLAGLLIQKLELNLWLRILLITGAGIIIYFVILVGLRAKLVEDIKGEFRKRRTHL